MPDMKFFCPHCTQPLEGPADMAGQAIDCPNCQKPFRVPRPQAAVSPLARVIPAPAVSAELQTNVKQGALIGSGVCLALGIAFMFWSLFWFVAYVPLFFAAFVLSIVAMAQKRVVGGILLLLGSAVLPTILFLVLTALRAPKAAEAIAKNADQSVVATPQVGENLNKDISGAFENAFSGLERKGQKDARISAERELAELEQKRAEYESQKAVLAKIRITSSKYYWEKGEYSSEPVMDISVRNDSGIALRRLFFHGTLSTPGRTVPWADDDFNFEIKGGIESGEEKHLSLSPNMFGDFANSQLRDKSDIVFTVSIRNAEDAAGNELVDDFTKYEEERLASLRAELFVPARP